MTRLRTIYVLRSAQREAETKPSCFIEVNTAGRVVYGVRASASSLRLARERAQEEFQALAAYVTGLQSARKESP